jgi:UDP-glucose 4-epimerase
MKITVTGGAGFVGSAIVRALLAEDLFPATPRGNRVRVVDDLSTGKQGNIPDGVDWHCSDAGVASYEHDEAIVHAAAYPDVSQNWRHVSERDRQWHANADLTRLVLDRAPQGAIFVLLSTCSVYGFGGEVDEHSPTPATSPYAASKLAAEALVQAYTWAGRVQGIILRLVNVVGPRYAHGHLADFVTAAKALGHLHALDDGAKRKSFVHADDVGQAVAYALRAARTTGSATEGLETTVANVTSEVCWSWRDSVDVMRIMRPEAPLKLTCEDRPCGWIGDPPELKVSSVVLEPGKRSIVAGVRDALAGLGW